MGCPLHPIISGAPAVPVIFHPDANPVLYGWGHQMNISQVSSGARGSFHSLKPEMMVASARPPVRPLDAPLPGAAWPEDRENGCKELCQLQSLEPEMVL